MQDYSEKERIAFLKAVANMIASDHKVTEDETADLYQLVLAAGLSPLDETVDKEVLPELDNPGDIKAILADIETPELKNNLFRILIEVASRWRPRTGRSPKASAIASSTPRGRSASTARPPKSCSSGRARRSSTISRKPKSCSGSERRNHPTRYARRLQPPFAASRAR
jgi:hypothetical protein